MDAQPVVVKNIRFPPDLNNELAEKARENQQPFTKEVLIRLRNSLKEKENADTK